MKIKSFFQVLIVLLFGFILFNQQACKKDKEKEPSTPAAAFNGNPTSGSTPLNVSFTDLSTNSPTSWQWNFGDGGTSTLQNPLHTYDSAGNFTVKLIATNNYGSDVKEMAGYVIVSNAGSVPVADFTGTPNGTVPLNVSFTDQSTNSPTSWQWNFGDGDTSTMQNPSHTYYSAGTYTVQLTVYNSYGSDTEVKNGYITAIPAGSTGDPCPGIPTITYEGQMYNTVLIGAQCWLKENLNIGTRINESQSQTNNSTIEKYCFNDDESNCNIYGGLYLWDEAMKYTTQQGTQGICPSGWHIPTDAEWSDLTTYLGGESVAGGKMKEAGYTHWRSPNTGATNESGFTALPGGYFTPVGGLNGQSDFGTWWSSTDNVSPNVWGRSLGRVYAFINRFDDHKTYGRSVRCLKN